MEGQNAKQVWQRVLAPPEAAPAPLGPLLLAAMEAAAAYRQLAGTLTGEAGEQARALYQSQRETVACLRGLMRLSGGSSGPGKPLPAPREPEQRLLEKAYYRAGRAVTEYTARSLDHSHGTVFHLLAQREARHCAAIAQLLGMLPG